MKLTLKPMMEALVVDDDEICTFLHRRIVEMSGCFTRIRSASNGHAAMEVLYRAETGEIAVPELILLDLHMPIMNGITFLKAFHRLQPHLKQQATIILLTDYISKKDKQLIRSLGVHHFLSKPLTIKSLVSVLDSMNRGKKKTDTKTQVPLEYENFFKI